MSAKYGIYRQSRCEWEAWPEQGGGWNGNTQAASAKVRRGGKHLVFKNKKDAQKWVDENSGKEQFFVRKVSKDVT